MRLDAAPRSGRPRIGVVILNYEHSEDTLRCLETLGHSTYRNVFPVVVDNGSSQDARALLERELTREEYIQAGENLGYAAGNNLGIRALLRRDVDAIWVLNPDTTLEPDTLEHLVSSMFRRPGVGIVGPRIFYSGSNPPTLWFDGADIDWTRAGATSHRNMGRKESEVPTQWPFATDYVTGAAMLVRRQVFEDVGLIPEDYFLYYEETDFNVRAKQAGWNLCVEPRSRMWHARRSQGKTPQPYYVYYLIRNRLLFGSRFTRASHDEMVRHLRPFIDSWRGKVEANAPHWVSTYDGLVARALDDGRAGKAGPVDELPPGAEA